MQTSESRSFLLLLSNSKFKIQALESILLPGRPQFSLSPCLHPWFITWARLSLDMLKRMERIFVGISRFELSSLAWKPGKECGNRGHIHHIMGGLVWDSHSQELEFTGWQYSMSKRIISPVRFRKIYFSVSPFMFISCPCTEIYSSCFSFDSANTHWVLVICVAVCKMPVNV